MDFALLLMSKLISLMLMGVVGYITVRTHLLRESDSKVISTLVVYVLQPCMIVRCFLIRMTTEKLMSFVVGLVFAVSVHLIWILVTRLLSGPLRLDVIDRTSLIYTNCGNLILPLVSMTLGEEYVFYAAAYQVVFNAFLWTHGYGMIAGDGRIDLKKALLNTNVISVLIGFVLMFSGFSIPDIIDTTLSGLAAMVGPSSMLVVGMVIAGSNLRSVFGNKKGYLISLFRLLLYPLLILGVLFATGFLRRQPAYIPVLQVAMLSVVAPPAGMVTQLAVIFDKSKVEASTYNVMGMFLCTLTMPLIMLLYGLLFSAA